MANFIEQAVDKVVEVVAPEKALKRTAARQKIKIINSGYGNYGANTTKKSLLGWQYFSGASREDIEDNLNVLRQRSRDLYAGAPIARAAINTMRTHVVGRGLHLSPVLDREILGLSSEQAQQVEKQILREWSLWADSVDCSIERLENFYELQQLAFLNWLMSGDCLVLLPTKPRINQPYDLRVQLIEADRISSPNDTDTYDNKIIGGVEVNNDGEIIAYHIARHHPLSSEIAPIKWDRVKAFGTRTGRRNVIFVMSRERIGQRRGVPFVAGIIEPLRQLQRYTDAEIIAAVVSGFFSVFIEHSTSDDVVGSAIPPEQQVDAQDDTTVELAPGLVMELPTGAKAHSEQPGRPNENFSGFVKAIIEQIGAALEIPYEVLIKHFSSSYTASKGALEEAFAVFGMYRNWLANDFCQPIYEEWLAEAVAKNRIDAPGFFHSPIIRKAYCGSRWNGPARISVDPVKETQAASLRVANGFSTRSAETMSITGGDYYANTDQLKNEEKKLREINEIRIISEVNENAENRTKNK